MTDKIGIPPLGQKPIDQLGFFSPAWHRFFLKLYDQAKKASDIEALLSSIKLPPDLTKKIEELEALLFFINNNSIDVIKEQIDEIKALLFSIPSQKDYIEDGTAAGQLVFWNGSKWVKAETSELFWDEKNKRLGIGTNNPTTGKLVVTGNSVDITSFDGSTIGLKLASVLITATAAELNTMDGITATTAELNYLDGVTGVGIANDNLILVDDADAADNDYAKFTANGLEGRNSKEVINDVSGTYLSLLDGAFGQPYLKTAQLNNLFYAADKRFTITKTGTTTEYTPSGIFNGNYGDYFVKIDDGNTITLNINLTGKSEYASHRTYSYGLIVVHFHYTNHTTNVRARLKTKNSGTVYEWRDWVTGVDIARDSNYKVMAMNMQGNYLCSEVEIEITANGNDVWISEIEWNMDRDIDPRVVPLMQKNNNNQLYGNLSFRDSSNVEKTFIKTDGTASFGGNVEIDDNADAGNTRLLLYDVDNATLKRVSVGAADSGGAGFKVLRIPN
ncbi:MAG: hypothetical protein DRZ76_02920 [Candidatus Nealsonbacteria bacterium]|nr:MAG: hypothetical protein DRZ76_02920 [Candidatus Nealsonbacteria bacterium]